MSTKQELIDKQPRFWELLAGGSTFSATETKACNWIPNALGAPRVSGSI